MNNHEINILNILKKRDKEGNIIQQESSEIEYRENFNFLNMADYARNMAAFANKKGGYIIFGIKDSPRKLMGIDYDKFNKIPQEKITTFLLEHFSPEIRWDIGLVENDSTFVGYTYTYEAENKPVICKKNKDNVIKNGEIYYRYRAQTKNIEYGELNKIIEEIKEKERRSWIKVFKEAGRIGPENVVISKKSTIEVSPSDSPKALPVDVKEEDIRKFYPYDYRELTAKLKSRYIDFKENQNYHNLRKQLKQKKEYCFTRKLDPKNPKSPKKDFYSEKIIKEFDRYYNLKS